MQKAAIRFTALARSCSARCTESKRCTDSVPADEAIPASEKDTGLVFLASSMGFVV
jgi:hypothetical protein